MKNDTILIFGIAFLAMLAGCAKSADDKVIAHVGNKVISLREVNDRIAKLPAYYKTTVSRNKKRFLDDLIVEEMFYEEAVRDGLYRDRETQDVIKEARKKIIIARLIKKEVEDKIKIGEGEIKAYYEEHKDEFKAPPMWRASHILVATQQEADEVLNGVNALGWNFEEIAKARSQDATASRGGDIGFFRKGQLVPEFEEACLKMNAGDPCQIVKTQFGYHVIKLTDTRPARTEEYDQVKGAIEDHLKRLKRKDLFNKLIDDLKDKYKVRIDESVLGTLET